MSVGLSELKAMKYFLTRRRFLGTLAPFIATNSFAQTDNSIPSGKTISLIVPFAAGGPTDLMARALANALSERMSRQVIVENKPGAGGNIAASFVANAPADGSHLLVAGQAIMAINKPLYGKLNYDPEKDFSWIGLLGSLPNVLVINASTLPVKSLAEMVNFIKQRPNAIAYGSNGIGSLAHLCTEVLNKSAGLSVTHIPYQGVAPQISDLLSGRIGYSLVAASSALPLVQSGKLTALAVSSKIRMNSLPGVPTLLESGFPMLDVPVWFGLLAPSQISLNALSYLRSEMQQAVTSPKYIVELEKQNAQITSMNAEQAQLMLSRERKIWAEAASHTNASAS